MDFFSGWLRKQTHGSGPCRASTTSVGAHLDIGVHRIMSAYSVQRCIHVQCTAVYSSVQQCTAVYSSVHCCIRMARTRVLGLYPETHVTSFAWLTWAGHPRPAAVMRPAREGRTHICKHCHPWPSHLTCARVAQSSAKAPPCAESACMPCRARRFHRPPSLRLASSEAVHAETRRLVTACQRGSPTRAPDDRARTHGVNDGMAALAHIRAHAAHMQAHTPFVHARARAHTQRHRHRRTHRTHRTNAHSDS